jgi:ferredoxin
MLEFSMPVSVNRYKCGYCGACVSVCPQDALELVETWIEVSEDCNNCSLCTKICPIGALKVMGT